MTEDAEVHRQEPAQLGPPVDPPREARTLHATVVQGAEAPLRPIVPGWLRNPEQRRLVLRLGTRLAVNRAGYHASRSPKYAAKVVLWAPVGLVRALNHARRWTWDLESWGIRQDAATRNRVEDYLALSRQRDARVARRLWVAVPAAAVVAVSVILLVTVAPLWARVAAAVVAAPLLAWAGRPADSPIVDRVAVGPAFTRLTGEMVRNALCRIGLAKIKEPGDVSFPVPVHRDGPGWLARVDLPEGAVVSDVLERRARLASALRLPIDQVWPAAGPDHEGQLDLWVGYLPASKMGQPRWSLASPTARTSVFEPAEFGTDQRQRPVKIKLYERNFLIGGVPGSGKSYAARTLVTIAALDPSAEMKIVEYKGTGDFIDLASLCSTYACGLGDAELATGLEVLRWGVAEAARRAERIRRAYERGEAPERKVTPELAARPGSGLHPVVIVIDEAHELFGDPQVGKEVADLAVRLGKRGRALGIILVLATQIPDKDSLPPGLTRVMAMRWCLAVRDWWANDAILGTGMYKAGTTATVYRPELDAGMGIVVGLAETQSVRAQFPGEALTKAIVARAAGLRGGVIGQDVELAPERDVLDDIIRVFATVGRPGMHWTELAETLADQWPAVYGRYTPEALSALARAAGVPSVDVKAAGRSAKGCRRDAVAAAIAGREVTDGR